MSSLASFRGEGDYSTSVSGYDGSGGGAHVPVSSADDVDPSLGGQVAFGKCGCCKRCF